MPAGCIAERGRKEPGLEEGTRNRRRGRGTRGTVAGKPETAEGTDKGSAKGRKARKPDGTKGPDGKSDRRKERAV